MTQSIQGTERPLAMPEGRRLYAGARKLQRLPQGVDEKAYTLFTLKPLGPIIGAEIEGVDLNHALTPELKEELNRALLEWKVIFFRNQDITSEAHINFARNWGELEKHPFIPQGETDAVARFAKDDKNPGYENVWHTDVTWRLNPAKGAVLRVSEVPPAGGDTLWADMAAAYDNLPQEVKDKIDGLTAVHDFVPAFGRNLPQPLLEVKKVEFPAAHHPIVRTHPETGRKTLYVNAAFTTKIDGLDHEESEKLLDYLFIQASIPEYQVRFHWEPNSIAFWDNRATQHYAVSDYFPNPRVGERVAVVGDVPY